MITEPATGAMAARAGPFRPHTVPCIMVGMARRRPSWDAGKVRALRRHLGLTQEELAREMGTRQQTISEWETGVYRPRGLSERLLTLIAERAEFPYDAGEASSHEEGSGS